MMLWACAGCLGDWSVACGMCRYVFMGGVGCLGDWSVACGKCRCVFYGCVSVASEIGR